MSGCQMGPPRYWPRQRGAGGDPNIRVSEAERSQVADALSKHFAEGRLDQTEFDERLHEAMSAKTRRDLAGLLSDLPPLTTAPAPRLHRHRRLGLLLFTVFLFFAAVASSGWVWGAHIPWVLVAVVLFLLWRRSRWHWHHHRRWPGDWGGPVPPVAPEDAPPWAYRRRGWWV